VRPEEPRRDAWALVPFGGGVTLAIVILLARPWDADHGIVRFVTMAPAADTQGSGAGQSGSTLRFALGRVGFLWLGVVVGPMLVTSGIVGATWGLAAGLIAALVCLVLLLGAAFLGRRSPEPRVEPPASTPRDPTADRAPRLLIAAGEAASGPEDIPAGIRSLIQSADAILVIAPLLPGRLDWLTSATDRAQKQADERLRAVLGHLDTLGADARGDVAADEPLQAFEDAIRQFAPDHLLIGLRAKERAGWQEKGLLDQIQQRFGLPTTVFELR
jgi:hypothetical protein